MATSPSGPDAPTESSSADARTPPATEPEPADADASSAPEDASSAPPPSATGEAGAPGGPAAPRRRPWRRVLLRVTAVGLAIAVLGAGGAVWSAYRSLDDNIRTDATADRILSEDTARPSKPPRAVEAVNILILGSDDRSGENARYGGPADSQRSDTTILLHIGGGGEHATAVSIPRDLMVDFPPCELPDGRTTPPTFGQFNWAYQYGGVACAVRTVEELTGVRIDHHMVVDFSGFRDMVDAVDGVEICLPEAVDDAESGLRLPAGRQTVHGEDALAYVRARKSLGDGSDTQRMERQQRFLAALLQKVDDERLLFDPARLYRLLDAVTGSLTTDSGLDSLTELYDLATALREVDEEDMTLLTVPRRPYHLNRNRDELVQPDAELLFTALREDRPVRVAGAEGASPAPAPSATATPAPGTAPPGDTAAPEGTASREGTPGPADDPTSVSDVTDPTAGFEQGGGDIAFEGRTAEQDICGNP
ncbi:LCP family protein [Allostreptomyces psammosilenae]|uniref:LCP family protein required for cell wall assembly n=1 Tax=Allostreptomyces psammosilenae TaxID=1892865 RepID=A0A852ZW16_9ACTN|nr:LCP family protein [Allostreptomyces psammosilenae]NYI06145.1 LCP family protein required for cell wall assembly [Allostreptomyces psammosilenae]